MTEIEVHNITKTYNPGLFKKKVSAVNGVSFEISQGEVFGLIGPNGAGKSSTIRMLLGLVRPESGHIYYRGEKLGENVALKEIGYLPENPYLYDHLTLRELLVFCGRVSGMSSREVLRRSQVLMEKLNIFESQTRPLKTFSKGMLQRAAICFALLHNPSVVIFDEPMSGLDPIGRKLVFDLIMELKKNGKTIFFCSHILNDVERLCDRIGLLHRGRLISQLNKNDLSLALGNSIFLFVEPLSQIQQNEIRALGVDICNEAGTTMLAINEDIYFQVNSLLERKQVKVLGSRNSWRTLEDLFLQLIEGQKI
ncbi:ABC transporter ATP-binding protein [Pelobacter seleniigenes]|uniref:ABC transporter ATP-binding protein n=1 Tax=Pelobacter seleniigenes TaxID=407188 RepID=UPI0006899EFD|nr:ABC transporter ATP-binding protein [Pelobacter seleniigenes]